MINVVLIIVVLEFASRAGNNRYGSFYYSEEEGIWGFVNSAISPDFVTKNDERVTTVFETRCRREFFIL